MFGGSARVVLGLWREAGQTVKALRRLPSVSVPVLLLLLLSLPAAAQSPGDLAAAFDSMRGSWIASVLAAMRWVFGVLMVLDFCWTGFQLALESGWSLKEWAACLIKFVMTRGFWGAVMLNGAVWIPSIIDSLKQIGVKAAGLPAPLSPNDIWTMGWTLASTLAESASTAAWLTDPASTFLVAIGALLIVISFAAMTATLIMTLAESYMALSVGYLFLGFGGSRWTEGYAKNYVNLALAIGTKIMVIYCVIGATTKQVAIWQTEMNTIDAAIAPLDSALDVIGGSIILAACVWMIPKALAAIMSGALSGTHGDLIAPVMTIAGIASMGASLALKGAGMAQAAGGAMGALTGGGSKSRGAAPTTTSASSTSRAVPPPPAPNAI